MSLKLRLKNSPEETNLETSLDSNLETNTKSKAETKKSSKVKLLSVKETAEEHAKKSRNVNKFFYKVSNHQELFKIGNSFWIDYENGVKSFAITSTGYQQSQQNSILGLASFFDHKDKFKIGIISDNIFGGSFKDIVSISKASRIEINDDYSVESYSFYDHFEFVNLNELIELSSNPDISEYDEIYEKVVDQFDVVFWDVPELHKIEIDSEKYFPMIMKFESLSIIVAQSVTNNRQVEEIKLFFLGYGINLKGLLLDKTHLKGDEPVEEKKSVKKPWWRIFS